MRREKKLAKTDFGERAEKTKNNLGKYLIAGTLMLAVSLSPKLKAQDFKWEECACGEPKMVQCGNSIYQGSKKVYNSEKGEYDCYCAVCPDSSPGETEEKPKQAPQKEFDVEAYLNELAKKELEKEKEPEVKKETQYKALPSVDVAVNADEKGFMEKWLELELKVIEKTDESVLLENGFSTTDYGEIKSKSTKKLKKIESTILKKLKDKGLEKPKTEKEAREFFKVITDAIQKSLGIKYHEEGLISKGLIENKLDCDTTSAITLQIADVLDLPIRVIITIGSDSVGHAFLAWEFENGDHLYYESTSGKVMNYKELMKKHEEIKKEVTSTCPDNDGDTICDSFSSSKMNMYNINPNKNPDVFTDAIARMNLLAAMRTLKSDYDTALNDLDFYWDSPEFLRAEEEYLSTMYIGGLFSSKAIDMLDPMIELVGSWNESAGIYCMRGDVYKSKGQDDKAAEDYTIAKKKYEALIESETKSPRILVGYGEVLMNLGEKSKAEKYLEKGISICSKRHDDGTATPSIYYWLGVALDAKGESSEAGDKYELGIKKCDEELGKPKYKYQIIDIYEVKYALYIRMGNESKAMAVRDTMKSY